MDWKEYKWAEDVCSSGSLPSSALCRCPFATRTRCSLRPAWWLPLGGSPSGLRKRQTSLRPPPQHPSPAEAPRLTSRWKVLASWNLLEIQRLVSRATKYNISTSLRKLAWKRDRFREELRQVTTFVCVIFFCKSSKSALEFVILISYVLVSCRISLCNLLITIINYTQV